MGMLINEAMLNLHAIKDYYNDDMLDSYVGFDRTDNESVEVAINTMRKYEKIEQILDDCDLEAWEVLEEIKKVVDDENT